MDTSVFEIREVDFGSVEYQASTELRDRVLRKPLGLKFSEVDLEKESGYRHFGLFHDQAIFATVMIVPHPDGKSQVRQMAVDFHWQRQGIGRTLLKEVEKRLQKDGIHHLFLHSRNSAICFYRHLDYKPVGDLFTEVGIPHQKMEKALNH
ncbi:MAG: GNAT family N-acetyltransferase [Verrucomicrobiae bacterium]|nr:GNAT family N-acetyltransferase [Verrucomicrobiae bacterium]NNJ85680.1 GNAT family N-acetyltransferase [Akkermansiaceae bacterium]